MAAGGSVPLLLNFLAARRERRRRLHDLYAPFLAATYVAYARWPDVIGAERSSTSAPDDGMLQLQHAATLVMMVEQDEGRLLLIDEILAAAEGMHSTMVSLDGRPPRNPDEFARKNQHWVTLLERRNQLLRLLRGSLS